METKIPFLNFEPMHNSVGVELRNAFDSVLKSNWFILGENLESFEKEYSKFNQCNYTIGVSNGLDALILALKALKIGVGDEVIAPSNTYIASINAISIVGAKPILVEPDILTYNIDPSNIERSINKKTKAILPVHLYGQACEMDKIMDIAKRNNLFVIEDNAQSQGAAFNQQLAGSFGHINGTSFYPGKNLGALGDAGAVTTNNKDYADEIKMMRNYGSAVKYHNETIGYNMRLDELQAAFLLVKLKWLNKWNTERQQVAHQYYKRLESIEGLLVPYVHKKATHVYHQFIIRTSKRDKLQSYLQQNNIGTLIHYPIPPHLQKAYSFLNYKKEDFPLAEEISNTCLSLPIWPGMSEDSIDIVCAKIKSFFT